MAVISSDGLALLKTHIPKILGEARDIRSRRVIAAFEDGVLLSVSDYDAMIGGDILPMEAGCTEEEMTRQIDAAEASSGADSTIILYLSATIAADQELENLEYGVVAVFTGQASRIDPATAASVASSELIPCPCTGCQLRRALSEQGLPPINCTTSGSS